MQNLVVNFSQRVMAMESSGIRKVFSLASKMPKCYDLSIGKPHFTVPEILKKNVCDYILNDKNAYTPSLGISEARTAVRTKYGFEANSEYDVVITSGVSGGLLLSFACILDQGDEILIPDPHFVGYKEIARLLGANAVSFDTYPDFVPRPEKIYPLLNPKTKAIVISNPSNPTGYQMSREEIDNLASFAREQNIFLIYDEIYEAFSYDCTHARPELSPNVIILNGLSKSHAMTGWRLAWAIAHSSLIEEMQKVQQFTYVCAPSPFQCVIPASLDYSQHERVLEYKRKRDYAYEVISSKLEVVKPGGAFYLFPKIKDLDSNYLVEKLIENQVLLIPSTVFSKRNDYFRLSFAVDDDILEEALSIIMNVL